MKPQLFITILLLIAPMNVASADIDAVYDAHIAWKTAFEDAHIAEIEQIWSHEKDTTLITLDGKKKEGFQQIKATLAFSFQITGKTEIDESNLLITLSGDKASVTSDYRWSPSPLLPLKATELYRQENGEWKMIAQDGAGGLDPLRKDDETRLRPLIQKILGAIALADIDKLKPLVAGNNTYVSLDGTLHQNPDEAVIGADLAKIQKADLDVVYLIDDVATAYLALTLTGNNERKVQFVINNFQLTKLDFAPKSLAVGPKRKLTTIWSRIKIQMPGQQ